MKNIIKRTLAITLAFAVAFTFIPALSGGLDAHAASKPAKVTKLSLVRKGGTVTLNWNKVKKNLNGYTVFRNGTAIASVGKGSNSFNDSNLELGTSYSYYVKAFRNTKQKQWFNKKTGKWQKKKPAKKYRGKSKKVKVKVYGKASPTLKCITGVSFSANAETENGNIVVYWTASPPVAKYVVIRDGKELATLEGNSYTDTSVEGGKTYAYTVRAIGSDGKVKAEIKLDPINASFRKVTLNWQKNGNPYKIEIYRDSVLVVTLNNGSQTSYEYVIDNNIVYEKHFVKMYEEGVAEPYIVTIEQSKEG